MSDQEETDAMDVLTRRDVMSGGSLALLGALGLSGVGSQSVAAQTGTEPRIQLGGEWEIDDVDDGAGNTDLRLRHQPTGASWYYDTSSSAWIPKNGSGGTDSLGTADDRISEIYGDSADLNSVSTGTVNNEVQVTTESELSDAIANGEQNIRVMGQIDVTQTHTITTNGTSIYGWGYHTGTYTGDATTRVGGDGLIGSIGSALLELNAPDCTVWGLGFKNNGTDGTAIYGEGKPVYVRHISCISDQYGFHYDNSGSDVQVTESEFRNTNPQTGSIGIYITGGANDNHVAGNIVNNFDVGLDMQGSTNFVFRNHFYGPNSGSKSAHLGPNTFVFGNRFDIKNGDGADGDVGVQLKGNSHRLIGNEVLTTGDADGIFLNDGGTMQDARLMYNRIENTTGPATNDTGIADGTASGIDNSSIYGNYLAGWSADGQEDAHIDHNHA